MTLTRRLIDAALIFAITFVTAAVVSLAWSLLRHGVGTADWGNAVTMGVILSVLLTWMSTRRESGTQR